ncbi:MAG: cation acetate symporter [Chloroflexaceae bacterium]|nr:cation acetate symporter [Chloroflexaceae bacterium]
MNFSETEIWTFVLVIISFGIYIYIGYMNRVRDTRGFYVAGQGVPAIANGAATAADWMSAASFISMAGLISTMGYDGAVYLMGWTGGYVLLAMLLAPYLRKFGKYTVPDFIGDRYYSKTARTVAAIAAIFVSFTYVAGQMRGVGIVFSRFVGIPIEWGVIIGMAIVAFFSVIGGMKGITWTQVAQYGVLILAYLIPSIAIAMILTGIPIPQMAFTFSDITQRLGTLQMDLGFKEYVQPFQGRSQLDILFITIALMVGTAGLPHVIVRFYTVPTVRSARYSAGWALLFIALLYTTAPAIAVFARYNLLTTLSGAEIQPDGSFTINPVPADELRAEHPWITKWETPGLLRLGEDLNGDGGVTVAPGNAFADKAKGDQVVPGEKGNEKGNEVYIDADIIVLSTPEVANLPPMIIGLVAAGGLAAALSTASGLLLVISSSISHDIYYRLINPKADEKRRLLVGRVMILIAVIIAGIFGIFPPAFVGEVVAFAFGLAAASFFPAIILGIFDKRSNNYGAIAGILIGLIFTITYIVLERFGGVDFKTMLGPVYVSSLGIGTVGSILNFAVMFIVSRSTAAPPQEIQDLVESVRIPRGAGEASAAH